MLERTLGSVDYENYAIWVGVYPNDPECQAVVRALMEQDPRVRMAVSRRPGPTTKADCLNQTFPRSGTHELATGDCYEIFMLHDAEDLVPADELSQANRACRWYDMAQFPVFPLPTPLWNPTHGVYCDEFAESHTRDLPARSGSGGFVPSAGVGTALRRDVVDQCRIFGGRKPFDPGSLTEDYVLGLRLEAMGFSQTFLADGAADPRVFPANFRAAVRQRTRWVIGNCLQAWERHGWPPGSATGFGGIAKVWSTTRSPCCRTRCSSMGFSDGRALRLRAASGRWAPRLRIRPLLMALLWTNAGLLLWRQIVRAYCVGQVYGALQAITVPLRASLGELDQCCRHGQGRLRCSCAPRLFRPALVLGEDAPCLSGNGLEPSPRLDRARAHLPGACRNYSKRHVRRNCVEGRGIGRGIAARRGPRGPAGSRSAPLGDADRPGSALRAHFVAKLQCAAAFGTPRRPGEGAGNDGGTPLKDGALERMPAQPHESWLELLIRRGLQTSSRLANSKRQCRFLCRVLPK